MPKKAANDNILARHGAGQIDRFKQTARDLGCDETGEAFERAFAQAVPAKQPPPSEKERGSK